MSEKTPKSPKGSPPKRVPFERSRETPPPKFDPPPPPQPQPEKK